MTTTRGRRALLPLLIALALALSGCGDRREAAGEPEQPTEKKDEAQEDIVRDASLYILLHKDPEAECLFLQSADTGRQDEFSYSGATYVYNRYGDSSSISQLPVGALVYLSYTERNMLTAVKEAADAFFYEDIADYRRGEGENTFSILGDSYYYDEDLKVFSKEELIGLSEVGGQDALTVRGVGRRILSIVVSRGHGTVSLKNTEPFQGGMVAIGNVESRVVDSDMTLEIPEGTYRISVALDGYGGSREVTVERFQDTVVDLQEIWGEGPQYCNLRIVTDPVGAAVYLDGKQTDFSTAQPIKYGVYQLMASAEGYEAQHGKLIVSSPEAEIAVRLNPKTEENPDSAQSGDNTQNPDGAQ